jgi:hypothetical protein
MVRKAGRFPVHSVSRRDYPEGWEGEVFTCDIDRTYLDTRFSSLEGIARIPFEGALDKVTIPGMAQLLKEVRRGPGEPSRHTPIYFVSSSPNQLRRVLERKFLLDGIEFDGTTFKNWASLIRRGRLTGLKKQVSYKLAALLGNRALLPPGAREILLGDDLEVDPLIYQLYRDILQGTIPMRQLRAVLARHGVSAQDAQGIAELGLRAGNMPGGVVRALIRTERSESPEVFIAAWPWLVPCHDAFQMALTLWEQGSLSALGVMRVARNLRLHHVTAGSLEASLREMVRRGLLDGPQVEELAALLDEHGLCRLDGTLPAVDPAWAAVGRTPEPR